jgi:hypothetical protein
MSENEIFEDFHSTISFKFLLLTYEMYNTKPQRFNFIKLKHEKLLLISQSIGRFIELNDIKIRACQTSILQQRNFSSTFRRLIPRAQKANSCPFKIGLASHFVLRFPKVSDNT